MITAGAAISAVAALASELGIAATPTVLADRSNLVLDLPPSDLVARVAMATSLARVGMAWLAREVDVARFLDAAGVPVTRPAPTPLAGPFERDGLVISLWQKEHVIGERADPAEAGRTLARAHAALRAFDASRLPAWGGPEEARAVYARGRARGAFQPAEVTRLDAAWVDVDRVLATAAHRTRAMQPVHGDAHVGNVLATSRGAVWTDWEDAFVGPVEWDLACMASKRDLFGEEKATIDAALASYDGPFEPSLLADLGRVRNVQVIVWLAVFVERQPELRARMEARLERL